MPSIMKLLFENFKLSRFLSQIAFYAIIAVGAIFDLWILNGFLVVLFLATIYLLFTDTHEIMTLKDNIVTTLSVFESSMMPFLQVSLITILCVTSHFGMLLLLTLTEALYIAVKKLHQSGYLV